MGEGWGEGEFFAESKGGHAHPLPLPSLARGEGEIDTPSPSMGEGRGEGALFLRSIARRRLDNVAARTGSSRAIPRSNANHCLAPSSTHTGISPDAGSRP